MTDENKYNLAAPAPDLFASSDQIEEQINEKVPEDNEEDRFSPSAGKVVAGIGIEVTASLAGNTAGAALAPFTFGASYPILSFTGGFSGSLLAQKNEGQPKTQWGRAVFAGFANLIPAGNTLKNTGKVSKLALGGRIARTGAVGSAVATADATGQALVDERRLPTLGELGFAASVGFAFGSTIDLTTIAAGPSVTKMWDGLTDKSKKLFLQMAGKTDNEINEAIAQKIITREELRHFKDLLVNQQYKDAGFVDGFLGNKKIDLDDIPPSERMKYIQERSSYIDDLKDEIKERYDEGEIDLDEYLDGWEPLLAEKNVLRKRADDILKQSRNQTPLFNKDGSFNIDESKPMDASETSPDINIIETTQGETQPLEVTVGGEKIPSDVPEAPATTATPKDAPEPTPAPKLYHGTANKFDDFDLDRSGEIQPSDWGEGVYFTDNPEHAKNFAEVAGGDIVMERVAPDVKFADGSKLLNDNDFMLAMDDGMGFTSPSEYLKERGFGGVKFNNPQGFTEYVVYDPKDIKKPTPAPKTPEVAPEADPANAYEFVALVDKLLTGDRRRGRGIQGTDKVARVFDQYRERLNTVISGLRSGASTMDEASALLDELVEVAPKKFELDNVDAGTLAIRNPDKDPDAFQELMTEEKAEIVADIERLRDVINFQKDVGEDFDNIEALRKRILGDVEEAPVVKPEEPTPTSKDVDVDAPKPTASQARIKKLEEETNLLHALVSGEDISQIDGVAGMHPSLKPKGNKTDTKTYEQFLNKRKAELKKAARELQKAEINVIKDRILNPAIYKRSRIDKALDVNFHARTAFGLSAPYSMTAGVVSAGMKIAITPIRDMLGSTLWKGLTLKDKSIVRKALYASSDLASYYEAFMTIFNKNTYRDTGAALMNRGKNPNFADGDVRFKEGYSADGEGNVRELAKQRKQIKRVEAQEGLKNTLNRIKLMDSAASVAMELINLPYTVIGAVDTPFASAMIMGKLRAEGLRAGIDQEVPDLAKFVDEYVDNAFKEQNGRKVWAYKQEYEHIRNQADEGLFKNRKLEDDDIRKTWTESMLDLATKHTTAGTISGRMIQSLMWVVTTPSIVVSEGSKFLLSPMLAPLRYVGKGAATLSPNSEFNTFANKIMARDKASFKKLRKEISDLKAKKEEAIGAKQNAVIDKELIQKNDSLKAVETRLEKNKVRMAEMDSKALGNAILATGMYIMFWDMSEKDMITGGGHWMNDDQKRESNFQPYMLLRDNGTGGHDYRMGEPYRIITSIIADVQKWHEYKEKGMLTEDQLDLTAMIARTIRGILQDSPFTGGVKNVMRVLSPTSAQDTRTEVATEMLFGMVPTIPNAFKAPKRDDQRYFDDRTQTRDLGDRLWQNLAASPAPNLKRDEYGRPKQRNKKNLASAVLRTAKQKFPMSTLREYELDQIIEADNRLGNIIGAVTTSYKTHDTKEYWRNGETTMYEDFQVFLQTFENSNGMTMIDEAIEIIQEDDWDELYNNGRLGSLNVLEEIEDIDEAYDQDGALKGGMSKDSNAGLEKLRDARNKTIKEAQAEFFQEERMEQYLNKDGEHPAQALMNQQQFEKQWSFLPQN